MCFFATFILRTITKLLKTHTRCLQKKCLYTSCRWLDFDAVKVVQAATDHKETAWLYSQLTLGSCEHHMFEVLGSTIDIVLNSLLCFALLPLLVAATKIHFKEQALVVANSLHKTKMSGQQVRQACLLCFRPACFVLCLLLMLSVPCGYGTN